MVEYMEFKTKNMLLLCTDSLKGYGINRIFQFAKEAGFDGIDLSVDPLLFDTLNGEYLKELSEQYGLPIHAIAGPKGVSTKLIRQIVKIAKIVDSKVVVLQPPRIHELKLQNWIKKEVPKLREKEFISIALENAPAGTWLGLFPEHGMSNTQDLKNFKHICLDTSRVAEKKKDLIRAYKVFSKFLVHVHLSNYHHGKKYSPPDQGLLPLESFLTKLKQDKYPGAISIKILPRHLKAGNDEEVVEELKRSRRYYEKYYANVEVEKEEE
jgi:sugar phosphate isomerase/epimerase